MLNLLVLLNIYAAFDTINHHKLKIHLHSECRLGNTVVSSFSYRPMCRTKISQSFSDRHDLVNLTCGIIQGSVLGSVLFTNIHQTTRKLHSELQDTSSVLGERCGSVVRMVKNRS